MTPYLISFYFYYCMLTGMPNPINTCAAGYFCRRNATTSTPDQGEDANICPVGHYCPQGTGEPNNCPLGTFGNDTGNLYSLNFIQNLYFVFLQFLSAFVLCRTSDCSTHN